MKRRCVTIRAGRAQLLADVFEGSGAVIVIASQNTVKELQRVVRARCECTKHNKEK
jgi:hypothetical protein